MLRTKNKGQRTKASKLWFVLFTVLGLVVVLQLVVSNRLSGKGEHLTELERHADQLYRENQNLAEELAQNSSLTKISQDAVGSGFEKPENIMYLDTANPVAQAAQ